METKPIIRFDNQYLLSRIEENKISKNLHLFSFQTPIIYLEN